MLKRPYLLKYYLPAYGQRSPAVLRKQPKQSYTQWGKPSHTRRSNPNLQGLGGGVRAGAEGGWGQTKGEPRTSERAERDVVVTVC